MSTHVSYLTWRELRYHLNRLTADELLDEPVLVRVLGAYDEWRAYPVQLEHTSTHPQDAPWKLLGNEESREYEFTTLDNDDEEHEGYQVLRTLPPGLPLLGFSEQDEDSDELDAWLKRPNPHTPPPPAPTAGPAPLFESL